MDMSDRRLAYNLPPSTSHQEKIHEQNPNWCRTEPDDP